MVRSGVFWGDFEAAFSGFVQCLRMNEYLAFVFVCR